MTGKLELRLVEKDKHYFGLVVGERRAPIEGDNADDVWRRLHDEAAKSSPRYFGYDGARNRFLHFFPNGFHSTGYADQERNYKVAAKSKLDATVPLDKAKVGTGSGEAVLAIFRATNLLSPFEKRACRMSCAGRALTPLFKLQRASRWVRASLRYSIWSAR
jgi:hypothetical protein